jgi:hypothetical protein
MHTNPEVVDPGCKIGFEDVDCFYRSFRFAVFGG